MSKKHSVNASSCGRTLRSAKKTRNSDAWALLPMEIRLMILEEISRQKFRGWTSCASVCREWQTVIERENFRQLRLYASYLDGFEHMVVRQRHLVQSIYLNIELSRYACRSCRETGSSITEKNSAIVRRAILRLFSVLSTWPPTCRLKLELNAYSPSDSEHWFKNYHFGAEHEDFGGSAQHIARQHDPKHGWVDGQQVEAPPAAAVLRLFAPLCYSLPEELPEVHAVTDFVICRQLRHQIFPEVLRLLWDRLPRLERIVYERWPVWNRMWKILFDKELASMLLNALPSRVKTISIFEDFNDQLALAIDRNTSYAGLISSRLVAHPIMNNAFASKSRDLERISISYMIDAQQFFGSCQPSYTWHHLQSLALTSAVLTRTASRTNIFALLHNAGSAALNMPQLESMVLWNGRRGEACAFIYQKNKAGGQANTHLAGNMDLNLIHEVVETWQKVASGSYWLRIENERIQAIINSHGDAIHHLRLPDGVIEPVSLLQIRQEGMMQRMA